MKVDDELAKLWSQLAKIWSQLAKLWSLFAKLWSWSRLELTPQLGSGVGADPSSSALELELTSQLDSSRIVPRPRECARREVREGRGVLGLPAAIGVVVKGALA